jgi:hypothetical protein
MIRCTVGLPTSLRRSRLRVIERLILQHLPMLEEAWDEHCER